MKTGVGIAAGVMAALLAVGPAAAVDYPGTASFDLFNWSVEWPLDTLSCSAELLAQASGPPSDLTINGAAHTVTMQSLAHFGGTRLKFTAGPPSGVLSKATINGADHLTCGADRLMLPGAIIAPAPVPTLSEWAMILLGVALAGGAALTIQRRRTA